MFSLFLTIVSYIPFMLSQQQPITYTNGALGLAVIPNPLGHYQHYQRADATLTVGGTVITWCSDEKRQGCDDETMGINESKTYTDHIDLHLGNVIVSAPITEAMSSITITDTSVLTDSVVVFTQAIPSYLLDNMVIFEDGSIIVLLARSGQTSLRVAWCAFQWWGCSVDHGQIEDFASAGYGLIGDVAISEVPADFTLFPDKKIGN